MTKFKNWLKLYESMDEQQNIAIKQLYIIIRDVLLDFRTQLKQNNFEKFEDAGDFTKFYMNFRKFYKPSVHVKKLKGSKLEINIPENIKSILTNLFEPFYISFPFEDDEMGGLVFNDISFEKEKQGKSDELRVSLKHLLDFERYKGTIQHELQHLVNRGTNTNYSQDNLLLRTMEYQCYPGEIYAYAKEYAYRYYKLFPTDKRLDHNKFKDNFYKKGFAHVDNYLNFGEDIERLIKQYPISDTYKEKMILCYNTFKSNLERSFLYFKNNLT